MEDSTPDFEALHKYLVDNSSEVFTPLIEAEEDDEKRPFDDGRFSCAVR